LQVEQLFIEKQEKMPKVNKKKFSIGIKATIKNLIVAFIYTLAISGTVYFLFSDYINNTFSLLEVISINTNKKILEDVKINLETKNLESYPEYGSIYATLKIPSLGISKPVYFGDTLSILKYGVGHYSGSYFPGEGGSVVYMGHNTSDMLEDLPNIKIDDKITIETPYGTYNYLVYDTKIIYATEISYVPIQREKEILMLYTCHKMIGIGYSPKRFVVYANLIENNN